MQGCSGDKLDYERKLYNYQPILYGLWHKAMPITVGQFVSTYMRLIEDKILDLYVEFLIRYVSVGFNGKQVRGALNLEKIAQSEEIRAVPLDANDNTSAYLQTAHDNKFVISIRYSHSDSPSLNVRLATPLQLPLSEECQDPRKPKNTFPGQLLLRDGPEIAYYISRVMESEDPLRDKTLFEMNEIPIEQYTLEDLDRFLRLKEFIDKLKLD